MLDALLRGEHGDGARLWESATALRLPHDGTFVVVAAGTPQPGVEAIRDADETLRRRGVRSAWRVEVDTHVGVVALTARTAVARLATLLAGLTAGRIGISEPFTNLDQTPAALRQARLAHTTATADGPQVARYEQVPVAVLLASTPDAAAVLARSVLGPVLTLPAAERDLLLQTLRTWFAEEGATSTAAAKLHLHRNTVRYRLRRIEELTGRSLAQPTGLAEVHLALEAVRVLRL
jgi:DNA-binding PucR family transcriptional regulator